jgi:MFS transporter, YNFM family, putative membrane transport protein
MQSMAATGPARSPLASWVGRTLAKSGIAGKFRHWCFLILFAFIGTFTYVSFVLASEPLSVSRMSLGFVYFVFLPAMFSTPAAGRAALSSTFLK